MVDFESSALLLRDADIAVVAGSVDDAQTTNDLAAGLRLNYVKVLNGLDANAIAASTGAMTAPRGDGTMLHATGFLLNPDGTVLQSVFASGPIGRLMPDDVLKKVAFERLQAAKS